MKRFQLPTLALWLASLMACSDTPTNDSPDVLVDVGRADADMANDAIVPNDAARDARDARDAARSANGVGCALEIECTSGYCVDGVCCDAPCAGTCQSCSAEDTEAESGTCAAIRNDTDPDDECALDSCSSSGNCDGQSACQVEAAGTLCRPAVEICDVEETCDGTSAACPIDVAASADTVCREAIDLCDAAETCTGSSNECPSDAFSPAETVCRSATGSCDSDDYCSGDSVLCPDVIRAGEVADCAPYRCQPAAPMCASSCTTSAECAPGFACMASVCTPGRRVFVTSTIHQGNLGGLAGADAICQARAMAADLPNASTFKAWLSDGSTSAASRLEHFSGMYYRVLDVTPQLVASSWSDLIDGTLVNVIATTELGGVRNTAMGEGGLTWTATTPSGGATPTNHCNGWTSGTTSFNGGHGNTGGNTANWTQQGLRYCNFSLRLYCIEQM